MTSKFNLEDIEIQSITTHLESKASKTINGGSNIYSDWYESICDNPNFSLNPYVCTGENVCTRLPLDWTQLTFHTHC